MRTLTSCFTGPLPAMVLKNESILPFTGVRRPPSTARPALLAPRASLAGPGLVVLFLYKSVILVGEGLDRVAEADRLTTFRLGEVIE